MDGNLFQELACNVLSLSEHFFSVLGLVPGTEGEDISHVWDGIMGPNVGAGTFAVYRRVVVVLRSEVKSQ